MRKALFAAIMAVCAAGVLGKDVSGAVRAARSVHLWYVPPTREKVTGVQATVTVRDTVPGSYFCAACFNMGYCGFQELYDGTRVFIFSVWDPGDPFDSSANPNAVKEERRVKCLFSKEGVRIKRFGGEGTGGQAMTPYPWKAGEPETVRITAAPDGTNRVAFTAWVKKHGADDEWERMATFSTLHGGKGAHLKYAAAFIEDFRRNFESAKKRRTADFTDVCFFTGGGVETPFAVKKGVFSAEKSPSRAVSAEPAPGGWRLSTGGDTPDRTSLLDKPMACAASLPETVRADPGQQEIKEWFLENYYGRAPVGRPADMEFKGSEIWIAGGKVKIRLDVTLPPGASKERPCPVVLVADRRSCFPTPIKPEKLKKILAVHDEFRRMAKERGSALVMWNVNDVAPDCWLYDRYIKMKPEELPPNAWGVFGLYGGEPDGRKGDTWGTIRAWAWGHSRVMDWIESRSELDAKRVAVCGHSRLGKAALVAGVTDERFLVAYSNDSGVGGAHPHRLWKPGVCKLSFVNTRHLHWLCLNSRKFEADERNMPHDMDEFLALMAPRYLYVASASEDWWAGPDGEQFAAEMASRAWERMNLKGWGYRGHVGGHVRPGGHDFLPYDFERFLDFCKTPFGDTSGR